MTGDEALTAVHLLIATGRDHENSPNGDAG